VVTVAIVLHARGCDLRERRGRERRDRREEDEMRSEDGSSRGRHEVSAEVNEIFGSVWPVLSETWVIAASIITPIPKSQTHFLDTRLYCSISKCMVEDSHHIIDACC